MRTFYSLLLVITFFSAFPVFGKEENLFENWIVHPAQKVGNIESQQYTRVLRLRGQPVPLSTVESVVISPTAEQAEFTQKDALKYFQGVMGIPKWNKYSKIGSSHVYYGVYLDLKKTVNLWITPLKNKQIHVSIALMRPGYEAIVLAETMVVQGVIATAHSGLGEQKKTTSIKWSDLLVPTAYAQNCPAQCSIFGVGSAPYNQCCQVANSANNQAQQYGDMINGIREYIEGIQDQVSSTLEKARRFLSKVKPIHVVGAMAAAGVFQGFTNAIGEALAGGIINGSMKLIGNGLKLFAERVLKRDAYREEVIKDYEKHLHEFADMANAIVTAEIEIGNLIHGLQGPMLDYIIALNKNLRNEKAMYLEILAGDNQLCEEQKTVVSERVENITKNMQDLKDAYFNQCELVKTNLNMMLDNIALMESKLLELGQFLFDDKKGERKYQRLLNEDNFWERAKANGGQRLKAARYIRPDRRALKKSRSACLRLLKDMDPRLATVYEKCIPKKMLDIYPANHEKKAPELAKRAEQCHHMMVELVSDPSEEKVAELFKEVGIKDKELERLINKADRKKLATGEKGFSAGPLPEKREAVNTRGIFNKTLNSRADFMREINSCHDTIYTGAQGFDESVQSRSNVLERRLVDEQQLDDYKRLKKAKEYYTNLKLCKGMDAQCDESNPFYNISGKLAEYDEKLNNDKNGLCDKNYFDSQVILLEQGKVK